MMWEVNAGDFETLRGWGTFEDPFAAIKDYSIRKEEMRWLNPVHRQLYAEYMETRLRYMAGK